MNEKKNEPAVAGPESDAPASERQCCCKCECTCSSHSGAGASVIASHEMDIYKALADLFNSEETSFWARNNILVIVQVGLIAATASFASNADKFFKADGGATAITHSFFAALFLIALVGIVTAVAWLFMVHRSARIADTISAGLKGIECEFEQRQGINLKQPFWAYRNFGDMLKAKSAGFDNFLLTDNCHEKPAFFNSVRLSAMWSYVVMLFIAIWMILLLTIGYGFLTSDFSLGANGGNQRSQQQNDQQLVKEKGKGEDKEKEPERGKDKQQDEQSNRQTACPAPACPHLTFLQLNPVGPFCLAKHSRESCKKPDSEAQPDPIAQPDPDQLIKLAEKIHDLKPVQLTLVGSADRINLVPALRRKYGSNDGLARARAQWVLEEIEKIWRQKYPTDTPSAVLTQAQILNVGPAGVDVDAAEENDRRVYVYVLVQDG